MTRYIQHTRGQWPSTCPLTWQMDRWSVQQARIVMSLANQGRYGVLVSKQVHFWTLIGE